MCDFNYIEARCIVCPLVFCCRDCRWKHEKSDHGLTFDCPICRNQPFLCQPYTINKDFMIHLTREHLPLHCRKCKQIYTKMEDLFNIDKCSSVSELLEKEAEIKNEEIDERFDSIYEKVANNFNEHVINTNIERKTNKTAVITPVMKRNFLVDYELSDTEVEETPKMKTFGTPHPKLVPKTPLVNKLRRQKAATPHVKKYLSMIRQKIVEDYDETDEMEKTFNVSPGGIITQTSRMEKDKNVTDKEMTTPNSNIQHILKIAQSVTTSTPTHPACSDWAVFPGQEVDSPLSEIENTVSPAQSLDIDPSKTDSENLAPKLKSIIITGSRLRLGSQDSSEKQVTFQDSEVNSDASSIKAKKVKFAEDTVFEQDNKFRNRVFRKPKRMLTPGPQKPRFCHNPRFQALINRFENQGMTPARTPVSTNPTLSESTPPVGEQTCMPARAINFKEDSPAVEENYSKESSESFKTCIDSPATSNLNNAVDALTANIAGSLQNCLSTAFKPTEEKTEIQFEFVVTTKKITYKKIVEDEISRSNDERRLETNKENIWSTVAKAVRSVFFGGDGNQYGINSSSHANNFIPSATKRKSEELSDSDYSPLNHKKFKYEGRIRGRPPLRRSKSWGVSTLRNSKPEKKEEDESNQSF